MKNLSLFVLFILVVGQMKAQNEFSTSINNLSIQVRTVGGFERDGYVEGTPYESKENTSGIFYQKNKTVVKTSTKLNYFLNSFEFVKDDKIFMVAENTIDSVIVNGSTYVYRSFPISGESKARVVKVVNRQNGNSLYIYQGVEFKPEVKAGGYVDPKPARYEWNEPFYLFELGDQIIALNNFKDLVAAFPTKENEIKKFIKENKISKDNPGELKVLLGFVSQL